MVMTTGAAVFADAGAGAGTSDWRVSAARLLLDAASVRSALNALCCVAQASKHCNLAALSVLMLLHCCQVGVASLVILLTVFWAVAHVDNAQEAMNNVADTGFMKGDAAGGPALG
jgi:hypothetical protein